MKLRYETTTCNRCGGSGRYSWNQRDGDRCWGCGGTGNELTKSAKKSRDKVEDLKSELLMVPANTIQTGDRVQLQGRRGFRTVNDVVRKSADESRASRDGTPIATVELKFDNLNYNMEESMTIRRAPNQDEVEKIVALAKTLPGVNVIEE